MIRHVIDNHNEPIPAVLEIPSKDHPYDASKDSILRRAKGMFSAEDTKWFPRHLQLSCLIVIRMCFCLIFIFGGRLHIPCRLCIHFEMPK